MNNRRGRCHSKERIDCECRGVARNAAADESGGVVRRRGGPDPPTSRALNTRDNPGRQGTVQYG